MPTKDPGKIREGPAQQAHERRSGVIVAQLLQTLGRPADLYQVEVRHLWDDRYRANVLVGAEAVSLRVAHSFFLAVDEDGNIMASTPDITRKY